MAEYSIIIGRHIYILEGLMAQNKGVMEKVIGREIEKKILQETLDSKMPELIAMFGRRRVGKTFLVRQYFEKHLAFEFTGTRDAKLPQQLQNFTKALGKAAGNEKLYRVAWNAITSCRYTWSWAASHIT
jgi:predicted AAA+ superfamily ATPase